MSNTSGPPIPAGWYRDPAGSDQLRWWDGAAWTSNLAPRPVPLPAPVIPTPVVQSQPVQVPTFSPTPTFTPIPTFTPTPTVGAAPVLPPVADPDERKYVPFQDPWVNKGNTYANATNKVYGSFDNGKFPAPARWNTAGVWFLATVIFWSGAVSAIVFGVLSAVGGGITGLTTNGTLSPTYWFASLGAWVVAWLLMILAASRDSITLRRLGYTNPPSVLWIILLPPLVYLIIRTVRVRNESGHGAAPLVFYLVSSVVVIIGVGIAAAIVIPFFLASRAGELGTTSNTENATELANDVTTSLDQSGGTYTVTCAPFAEPKTEPVQVSCVAIDSHHTSHDVVIEITPGTDGGKPTLQLMSVNPPLSNG